MDVVERFWSKVAFIPFHECWEWDAGPDAYGYGQFSVKLKKVKAHRMSYELAYGEIPDSLWVLHRCDNPGCVRPEHLYLGTVQDNVRDMIERGRHVKPSRTPGSRRWLAEQEGRRPW